jgi:hypothetical protein
MRAIFGLLVSTLILVVLVVFTWMHLRHAADSSEIHAAPILEKAKQAQTTADPSVTLVGPLSTYMSKQGPVAVETVQAVEYKPTTADRVGGSVAGTSMPILHDKFHVSVIVDLPFNVPPHAAMPQLHGTFRSFLPASAKPTGDTDADVEFHLLNDQQYSNFLNAKPSEALFSADATHDEEVNASLPPSLNKPVTYHMVFVNESRKKKVVQADFRLDF